MLNALYSAGYDAVIMESQFDRDKTNEHLSVLKNSVLFERNKWPSHVIKVR